MADFWPSVLTSTAVIFVVIGAIVLGIVLIAPRDAKLKIPLRAYFGGVLIVAAVSFAFACFGWACSPHYY